MSRHLAAYIKHCIFRDHKWERVPIQCGECGSIDRLWMTACYWCGAEWAK